jgi:oligopeptide/dipeptide ABC transporter ATP-binding protein
MTVRTEPLLEIRDLEVELMTVRGIVHAVQGTGFSLGKGEVLGIVGESGCGKSVLVKSILRLHKESTTQFSGSINFDGTDILSLGEKEMLAYRGVRVSMIFQDPMNSLNPIIKVGEQIAETLRARQGLNRKEAKAEAIRLLYRVGIKSAEQYYDQYPFEFSGGMLQRVNIAIAIALKPELLIADEATTALDVTIQAEILNLLKSLRTETDMSMIIVSHDFGVITEICENVAVMYAGNIVEYGSIESVLRNPAHPYTRALIASVPKDGDRQNRMVSIPGAPPALYERFDECAFYPRCDAAGELCRGRLPEWRSEGDSDHLVKCLREEL